MNNIRRRDGQWICIEEMETGHKLMLKIKQSMSDHAIGDIIVGVHDLFGNFKVRASSDQRGTPEPVRSRPAMRA